MANIYFQSFIDIRKWDDAKWSATAFLHDPSGVHPPYLGIVFENIEAGKQIFSEWIDVLGAVDEFEELRIAVVEGEILGEEPGYSIHISSDPFHTERRFHAGGRQIQVDSAIILGRFHRMVPAPGSPHLPWFKEDFRKHKRYFLMPVSRNSEPLFEYAIGKTEIHFRQASDITREDLDAVVFPDNYFDHDEVVH